MALLEVARIARAHGLRGEVIVELLTNREERLDKGSVLLAGRPPVGDGNAAVELSALRSLEVLAARPFQHRHIVHFRDVTTREGAEALHGSVLSAEPIEDDSVLFVHELIGCALIDQHGHTHGVITAVQANPASDLLVVEGRHLVPAGFVTGHDEEHVYVDVPDGLFDV